MWSGRGQAQAEAWDFLSVLSGCLILRTFGFPKKKMKKTKAVGIGCKCVMDECGTVCFLAYQS